MRDISYAKKSTSTEERMGLMLEKTSSDLEHDDRLGWKDTETRFPASQRWTSALSASSNYIRSFHLKPRFLLFFVPSFLQSRHFRDQIRPAKLHPTAYLDGMRGLAALFVYFCHYSYQAFTIAESWGCGDNNYSILKFPILRLWYQGPAAVCVFFVISGYALSYRPLKFARSHSFAEWSSTMSSLAFRRWIRLFVPPIISTFMVFCLIRGGAYELTRDFANDTTYHKNVVEPHYQRFEDPYEQFWDWARSMFSFVHVWDWELHGGSTGKF